MVAVYGGDLHLFPFLADSSDDVANLKRFEEIERRILDHQTNNQKLMMQEYDYKPTATQRILMTEVNLREYSNSN